MSHRLVDIATDWLSSRSAAYLAKEDQIVYYASLTGRESDFQWHTLTLQQAARILRATQLNLEEANQFQSHMLVQACQELGRVYEFGVRSNRTVADNIFNYFEEANVTMEEQIAEMIVSELVSRDYVAFTANIVGQLAMHVKQPFKDIKWTELHSMLNKHLEARGFIKRAGAYRPQINGSKVICFMKEGTKPKQVVTDFAEGEFAAIRNKIHGALS